MSKKWLAVLVIAFALTVLVPLTVSAMQYGTGETYTLPKDKTIDDDLYISQGEVTINGTVKGDLYIMAGMVTINGRIEGDLNVFSGQVDFDGVVTDDVRIGAGQVVITGKIGDDLILGSGTARIGEEAEVKGDLIAGAGQMTIAGATGDARLAVGELELTQTAKINGDLLYVGEEEATISSQATVGGEVIHRAPPAKPSEVSTVYGADRVISLLTTIVICLLLVYLFRGVSTLMADRWRNQFGINLLYGLLVLIGLPIAAIIMFVVVFLMPLGFGIFLVYPALIYLSKIVGVVALGYCLQRLWNKKLKQPDWISVVVGAVALYLLAVIPIIGSLGVFIVQLVAIGVIGKYSLDLIRTLKSQLN